MSESSYAESLKRVLSHEGGYSNHPSDPGGPTNFGITLADVRKYLKHDALADDVKHLDLEKAKIIYRKHYWESMRCDELPAGVDYSVFDYAVNSGVGRPPKILQRILHLPLTLKMDDATMAAINQNDASDLIRKIATERLAFLHALRTWPVFGKGWGIRVAEVKTFALILAKKTKVTSIDANNMARATEEKDPA